MTTTRKTTRTRTVEKPTGYTDLMQTIEGIGFCACEADCSWLHYQHWFQRMSWDELMAVRDDPRQSSSFAVTHCAAAAVLPEGLFPRPDQFSVRDMFTRYVQVTWTCPGCKYECTETIAQLAKRQPRSYTLADVDAGDFRIVMCDGCRPADSVPEDQLLTALASYPDIREHISRRRLPGSGHRPDAVIDLPTGPLVIEYDGHHANHDLTIERGLAGKVTLGMDMVVKDERITQAMIDHDQARVIRLRMPKMPRLHLEHHHDQLLQFSITPGDDKQLHQITLIIAALVQRELEGDTTIWQVITQP